MWKKDSDYQQGLHDLLLIGIILLIFAGIFLKWTIVLAFVLLILGYMLLHSLYDKQLDKKLSMKNERHTIRIFPGEEAELLFTFENKAVFPYLNGHFRFQSATSITTAGYLKNTGDYLHTHEIPLTIAAKGKTKLKVPIKAQKRGVVTLRNIQLSFSHLTGFENTVMAYDQFYHQEVLIYPRLNRVKGVENLIMMNPGSAVANVAIFEDKQTRIGVRDYLQSDSFDRINWKATAKAQALQTNVYQRVLDKSYMFLVNISSEESIPNGSTSRYMEDYLSYTAYLCQYANQHQMPFSIHINARRFVKTGRTGFFELEDGQGDTHFLHGLDMLARIHTQGMMMPFDQMVKNVGENLTQAKTIIVIGEISEKTKRTLTTFNSRSAIFQVNADNDEFAILERFIAKESMDIG